MSEAKVYNDLNSGIIGKNDYKQQDKHPDMRGRINVEGVWYWVSGWNKTAGNREFTSLALTIMTQSEVDEIMKKRAAKLAPQQTQQQPPAQPAARENQAPAQSGTPAQNPDGSPHASAQAPMDFDDDIPF